MFDSSTLAAFAAAALVSPAAAAQAVRDELGSGTLTVEIRDGATLVYSGTFAGPLTANANGTLSVDARPSELALQSGTPNAASWTARIRNAGATRWIEGPLGPGGRFTLARPLVAQQRVRVAFTITPPGGAAAVAPSILSNPVVLGVAQVGNTATGTASTASGTPTPAIGTRQWQRADTAGGAYATVGTGSSYTYQAGDSGKYFRIAETWTNAAGSATAYSSAVGPVAAAGGGGGNVAPSIVTQPVVLGLPAVSSALSALPSTATGTPTPTLGARFWQTAAGMAGPWSTVATASGYTPVVGDLGKYLRCGEPWTNSEGTTTAYSPAVGPIEAAGAAAFLQPLTVSYTVPHEVTIRVPTGGLGGLVVYRSEWFKKGEIADFPEVLVDGAAVLTQADVLQRWEDGSVKHAILHFYVPAPIVASTATLTFQNDPDGGDNNAGWMTTAQMTEDAFASLDCTITVTGQGSQSLRAALLAGHYTRIRQGPVCTEVHVVDWTGTATRLGAHASKPYRAQWYVRFYPGLSKARVLFAGSIDDPDALTDMDTVFTLTGAISYTRTFKQFGGQRFDRVGWFGAEPQEVYAIPPLAYYIAAGVGPLLDQSDDVVALAKSTLQSEYNAWLASPREWGEAGLLQKAMTTGGGRPDIGPTTRWVSQALITGDHRALACARMAASCAGGFPAHLVESRTTRYLDRAQTVNAQGHPPTSKTRPLYQAYPGNTAAYDTNDAFDEPGVDGLRDTAGAWYDIGPEYPEHGWKMGAGSHNPDYFGWLYWLTGEDYYLQQLRSWAAFCTMTPNPGSTNWQGAIVNTRHGMRDKSGGFSGFPDRTVRFWAWGSRERTLAHFLTPDAHPTKPVLKQIVEDNFAMQEGMTAITGTGYDGHPAKTFAQARDAYMWRSNTLRAFDAATGHNDINDTDGPAEIGYDIPAKLGPNPGGLLHGENRNGTIAVWMEAFRNMILLQLRALGYPVAALLAWVAPFYTKPFTDAGGVPEWLGVFSMPAIKAAGYAGGGEVQSTADMAPMLASPWGLSDVIAQFVFNKSQTDQSQNYGAVAYAATAAAVGQTNGALARKWAIKNIQATKQPVTFHWNVIPPGETTVSRQALALEPGEWSPNLATPAAGLTDLTPSLNALDALNRTPLQARNGPGANPQVICDWSNKAAWNPTLQEASLCCMVNGAGSGGFDEGSGIVTFNAVRHRVSTRYSPLGAGFGMGHGYDNTAIDVAAQRLYKRVFNYYHGSPEGRIAEFDARTKALLRVLPAGGIGSDGWESMDFVPGWGASGSLVVTDPGVFRRFDRATDAWDATNYGAGNGIGYSGVCLHLPNANLVVYGGGTDVNATAVVRKFWKVTPGSGAHVALDDAPVGVAVSTYESNTGFKAVALAHPDGTRVVVYCNAGIYILNPNGTPGAQWTRLGDLPSAQWQQADGAGTPSAAAMSRTFGWTMPEYGVIALLQEDWHPTPSNRFWIHKVP